MRVVKALLLIVVVLVAAAVVSNVRIAMNRSHQKRTMAAMRDWAVALEAGHLTKPTASYRKASMADGWGRPFRITTTPNSYTITSLGRDGHADRVATAGAIRSFDCDIVYSNGSFVSWPEGI